MYFKVFVSVVLFSLIQSVAINCKYEAADGIHFDLSPLMNNEKDYRIYDYLSSSYTNRTQDLLERIFIPSFVFNVCRNVLEIPKDGKGGDACKSTVHDKDDEGHDIMDSSIVPAFLVSNDEAECTRVSSSIEKGNVEWTYYGKSLFFQYY